MTTYTDAEKEDILEKYDAMLLEAAARRKPKVKHEDD
jgi:hypothetical protein